jgi:hypothetical protein
MSKPTDSDIRKSSSSGDRGRPDNRLVKAYRISKNMRLFVHRMRMRARDIDFADLAQASEFDRCSETMRKILTKKKISRNDADKIVAQTLDAAADHQLEGLRRDWVIYDLDRSKKDLRRLIKLIDHLAHAISVLPPLSKGKLNKIIAKQNWRHFDTEIFSELMHAMQDALSTLSPARVANDARLAIMESLRASKDPAVTRIVRTAPPAITELWEIIPAETRTHVEAEIQRWTPPKRGQVIGFLKHVVGLLKKYRPRVDRRRRPPIVRRYLQNVATIWRSFGLNVGHAYGESKTENAESHFQRFARLGLLAAGDFSVISVRQIRNLKSELRPKSNMRAK